MTDTTLSFESLQSALERCMQAHPPEGTELRLHPDANALAGLWGLMSYERTGRMPVEQISKAVLDAYERWSEKSKSVLE